MNAPKRGDAPAEAAPNTDEALVLGTLEVGGVAVQAPPKPKRGASEVSGAVGGGPPNTDGALVVVVGNE